MSAFSISVERFVPLLRQGRWFASLSEDFQHFLISAARVRQLQAQQALFLRGAAPCGLYAVAQGAMRISGIGSVQGHTRESILIMLKPPTWFGEISLFDAAPRTHDAHAAEVTTLIHIPQDPLLAWLQAHPAHWRELALLMADKLRLSFTAIEEQALLPAPMRLARRLVQMAQDYGQGREQSASRRAIEISQDQLSLMLAISRQTANQILKDLEAKGMLRVRRGAIEIIDLKQLQASCN